MKIKIILITAILVIIILIAYYLLSVGRWPADCLSYQWLNFIGAWLILFSLYFHTFMKMY